MWSHLVTTVSSLLFHKQITWGEPSLDARYILLALGILLLSCFYPFFTIWTILNISNIIHFFNRVYPHHSSHENTEMNIENATVEDVTKALIHFISARNSQPFWRYEYITKSVWTIKSAEQIDNFVQHILRVFEMSLPPNAHLAERWSQLSLQLALSCSSRHYAGRSLQIFRALRVPITARMLSDILSRLVETIAEQGDDMQGN